MKDKTDSSIAWPMAMMLLVVVLVLSTAGPCRAGQDATPYFTDRGQLGYARFLVSVGEYDRAVREFDRVIESFPGSSLLADAQLGKATAYFKAGRYHEAERVFRLFIENFNGSPHVPGAARMVLEARRLGKAERAAERERQSPVAPAPVRGPINAVQVAVFDGLDLDSIDSELARLKSAGVDTVIVRVFHNREDRYYAAAAPAGPTEARPPSGVYFKTSHAPVVADLLGPLTRSAHSKGLKLFAWMTTRYADYGLEDDTGLACIGYDIASGALTRCKGLDLFNERAVRHLEGLYSDLAEYDIDGILFQDDLVLRHTEGFGPHAESLFEAQEGARLDPERLYIPAGGGRVHYTPRFWKWAAWKNKRLLTVAGRLKQAVRRKRPGAEFAINMMYESVTNPPYALAWLSQDLEKAVAEGFEYYSIMAYHRQMAEELGRGPRAIRGLISRMVAEATRTVGQPERVLMKVQTIDWGTGQPLSDSEVVPLIREIRAAGGVSLAVVPYRLDFPFYEISGRGYARLD